METRLASIRCLFTSDSSSSCFINIAGRFASASDGTYRYKVGQQNKQWRQVHSHLPPHPKVGKTTSKAAHPVRFLALLEARVRITRADEKTSTKSLFSSILEIPIRPFSQLPSPSRPILFHPIPLPPQSLPTPSHLISFHFLPFPKRLSSRNILGKIKMPRRSLVPGPNQRRISQFFAPIGTNSAKNASQMINSCRDGSQKSAVAAIVHSHIRRNSRLKPYDQNRPPGWVWPPSVE